jgi:hypothetical protein
MSGDGKRRLSRETANDRRPGPMPSLQLLSFT